MVNMMKWRKWRFLPMRARILLQWQSCQGRLGSFLVRRSRLSRFLDGRLWLLRTLPLLLDASLCCSRSEDLGVTDSAVSLSSVGQVRPQQVLSHSQLPQNLRDGSVGVVFNRLQDLRDTEDFILIQHLVQKLVLVPGGSTEEVSLL